MFVFLRTSHVKGRPFMLEVMLRSGVPPHMGQSPVPGSDASTAKAKGKSVKAKSSSAKESAVNTRARLTSSAFDPPGNEGCKLITVFFICWDRPSSYRKRFR